MIKWILAILVSFPVHYSDVDEPADARQVRMGVLAKSIDQAVSQATCRGGREECSPLWPGRPKELAAYLLAVAWWETRLAGNVMRAQCPQKMCDNGLARSPWQFHSWTLTKEAWDGYQDATLASVAPAAMAATRVLSRGARACHSPEGVFSYYNIQTCVPSPAFVRGARQRVSTFRRLVSR